MKRIAIIGAGISGLSIAKILNQDYDVDIYERNGNPGGLIRCERVGGNLFHICGGHVFNSKRQDVLKWFASQINIDTDFFKVNRNSSILMQNGDVIPYPIENHFYLFNEDCQKNIINDIVEIANLHLNPSNFEDFLLSRFGKTLYNLYFKPYNVKIWKSNLKNIPLAWLEGKLPMPTATEIIYNNINKIEEKQFVHASFYYPKNNGSQYIVDSFAKGLNIYVNSPIDNIQRQKDGWVVNGIPYDAVVFCGNIKELPSLLHEVDTERYYDYINKLKSHGTTSVFCELIDNPYTWIYLPDDSYQCHRIICTGNLAKTNNKLSLTGVVEFTDYVDMDIIQNDLNHLPFVRKYITHHYNQFTYPIQDCGTRGMIKSLKQLLEPRGFYLLGRFAEWEYYNMDVAMGAALDLCNTIHSQF